MTRFLPLFALIACTTPAPEAPPAGDGAATAGHEGHAAGHEGGHGAEGHAEPAPATAAADANGWSHYGATFTVADTETIQGATFLADPAPYVGKTVRVEGKVSDVCQKAGCWMVIADGDKTLRVRMKNHDFSVDKAGAGCTAAIEGQVVAIPVDPKTVEHYASESADASKMPEHNAKDGTVYEIEATGVAMKRG